MPGVSISTTMSGWKLLKPVVWTRISIPTENGLWTRSCPAISWTAVYPELFWRENGRKRKRDDLTELQTGMSGLRCRQIQLRYLCGAQRMIATTDIGSIDYGVKKKHYEIKNQV